MVSMKEKAKGEVEDQLKSELEKSVHEYVDDRMKTIEDRMKKFEKTIKNVATTSSYVTSAPERFNHPLCDPIYA